MLAALILTIHLTIILFNVIGLAIIPIGAWRGWRFVHAPIWRLLHVASWMIVALQAVLGRACFLTEWQSLLEGRSGEPEPLVMRWVNSAIYWPLPIWVFSTIYLLAFTYVLALLWIVPLGHCGKSKS
jgi:hypothetical protein